MKNEIINRIEVIGNTGRMFTEYLENDSEVKIDFQDGGKTMKIFLRKSEVKIDDTENPYIEVVKTRTEYKYNPEYGDSRICVCDHPYHRHFDSYDEDMRNISCKYCECDHFIEAKNGDS